MANPVWLNESAKLYTVTLERPDKSRIAYMVLTNQGPIKAKDMVPVEGRCIKSQEFPFPLITPSLGEVEHLLDSASTIAQTHRLRMYRFTLDCQGQRRICLVWTKGSVKSAGAFAESSLMGSVKESYGVTNPVIIDCDVEELFQAA